MSRAVKTIAMLKAGASKPWIIKEWLAVQVSLLVVIGAVLGIAIGIGFRVSFTYSAW